MTVTPASLVANVCPAVGDQVCVAFARFDPKIETHAPGAIPLVKVQGSATPPGVIAGRVGRPEAWVIVNVCPATVIVPVRVSPEFASMMKVTCPFPVPVEGNTTWTQVAALEAVQAQPGSAVTAKLPVTTLPAPTFAETGLIEYVQFVPADIVNEVVIMST